MLLMILNKVRRFLMLIREQMHDYQNKAVNFILDNKESGVVNFDGMWQNCQLFDCYS